MAINRGRRNQRSQCLALLTEQLSLVNDKEFIANEAADPRGSAVELANHRAVCEYKRKISCQRKGLF